MKWLAVIVLAIIGVLAAIVAVEYLTVPIHSLPSFIPGAHPGRGHYHKRGAVAAVIAVVALAGAVVLAIYFRRLDAAGAGAPATTAPVAPEPVTAAPTTPVAPAPTGSSVPVAPAPDQSIQPSDPSSPGEPVAE